MRLSFAMHAPIVGHEKATNGLSLLLPIPTPVSLMKGVQLVRGVGYANLQA